MAVAASAALNLKDSLILILPIALFSTTSWRSPLALLPELNRRVIVEIA
jgi:hypothetical protein